MIRRLSKTSFFGLAGGIACVIISIFWAGNIQLFINIPSLLIIVGGTTCSLVLSFPFSRLKTLGSVMKKAFVYKKHDLERNIEILVNLGELARREGLLSLEEHIPECEDKFLKKGLMLIVDGTDRESLESSMMAEMHLAQRRHRNGYAMINMIASLAPALGLLGTYVGLIPMLVNLDDPTKLGPLMAIELVSSFYGAFLAYIIFSPMGKKLMIISSEEKEKNEMLLEGILGIQSGQNPRIIRENLLAFLTEKESLRVAPLDRSLGSQFGSNVIDFISKANRRSG